MATLTLDTATSIASVGLVLTDGTVFSAQPIREPNAAQHVLGAVDRVLTAASIGIAEVKLVAVGRGPGSFTGLRIGLATAFGLGEALSIPIVGVDTLVALCAGAPAPVVAVIDARRGEVFAYGEGVAAASYSPEQLALLVDQQALLVGDGALRYRELLAGAGCCVADDDSSLHWPATSALCELALKDPQLPTALYLRAPDAVPAVIR